MKRPYLLPGLCLLALALFQSCSTMAANEQRRLARLNTSRPAPTASVIKPSVKPGNSASAATPATGADASQLPAAADPLAALLFSPLPNRMVITSDYELVLARYTAFVEAAETVLAQVKAYGLGPQLSSVQRLRLGSVRWNDYFRSFQFLPKDSSISKSALEAFYTVADGLDKRLIAVLSNLNTIIDGERTKPWKAVEAR